MPRILASLSLLLAVILLAPPADAGSKEGPRRWSRTLKKNSEVVYKIVFTASNNPTTRAAEFCVIGDGGTDVDLEVFDSQGNLVARDYEYTDLAMIRWVPAQTQEYTIKVKNLGAEENVCHMGHN